MRLALGLAAVVALSGCANLGSLGGGSSGLLGSIGSLGLGGPRVETTTVSRADLRPLVPDNMRVRQVDARPLATTITRAEMTPTLGGAILSVTGIAAGRGAYNAALVPMGRANGALTFALRAAIQGGTQAGPSRISVAHALSQAELSGIRQIRIRSASGTRVLNP